MAKRRLSVPGVDMLIYSGDTQLTYASVVKVFRGSGGNGHDTALIRAIQTDPLVDSKIFFSVQDIEIMLRGVDDAGKEITRVIFWGKSSGLTVRIDADGNESAAVEFRQTDFHFGPTIDAMDEVESDRPTYEGVVFNPIVDGVVRGNRFGDKAPYKFLDPLRVLTENARRYVTNKGGVGTKIDEVDKRWTIRKAAEWLCGERVHTLANSKRYIDPPNENDFDILPNEEDDSKDAYPLRGLRIPVGSSLPQALDLLLTPYGFGWHVVYEKKGKRRIGFFRRGESDRQKKLYLQRPKPAGAYIDPKLTNQKALMLGTGYQSLFNYVRVLGARKRYESTFVLVPAWDSQYDSTPHDKLELPKLEKAALDDPGIPLFRVWRDWVLNEAGDYNGTRSTVREPYKFAGVFPNVPTSRRRRFLPCISLDAEGRPLGLHGYEIEWSIDGGLTWLPLTAFRHSQQVQILTDECGLRFSGMLAPRELMQAGSLARVRITCSVEDDDRLTGTYPFAGPRNSIQPDIAPRIIDAGNRYQYRKVTESSKFSASSDLRTSEVDDGKLIDELAKRLVETWDQADVSGTAAVVGLLPIWNDTDYEVGDVLTQVSGRNIDLSTGASAGDRYVQIVGMTYENASQGRILHLQTFRDARIG